MRSDRTGRRTRRWRRGATIVGTFIALAGGFVASPVDPVEASTPRWGVAQNTTDDACRFFTADAMGKAFGRPLKSSKLTNVCEYRGAGTDRVVVKVAAGPEGTIFRHLKGASTKGDKGAEKVTSKVGEAYFDNVLSIFVGRVGNHEVQLETTIEPVPRDTMISVGGRIMEALARK